MFLGALSNLPTGKSCIVSRLMGGREFKARAVILGLTIGAQVTVLQNCGRGPMIVLVRDARLALGRGEAVKILVEEP
jgi:ferrous iron transport protein A